MDVPDLVITEYEEGTIATVPVVDVCWTSCG